jgi:hypothetical protein
VPLTDNEGRGAGAIAQRHKTSCAALRHPCPYQLNPQPSCCCHSMCWHCGASRTAPASSACFHSPAGRWQGIPGAQRQHHSLGVSTTRRQHELVSAPLGANWCQHKLVSAPLGVSSTRCQHKLVSAPSAAPRCQHELVSAPLARCQHELVSAPLGDSANRCQHAAWCQHELVSARIGVSTNWCQHRSVSARSGASTARSQPKLVSAPLGDSTSW